MSKFDINALTPREQREVRNARYTLVDATSEIVTFFKKFCDNEEAADLLGNLIFLAKKYPAAIVDCWEQELKNLEESE